MYKSIQQFVESGLKKLEKAVEEFMKKPQNMAEFVYSIRDGVIELALNIIQETLEDCDQMLRDSGKRKKEWEIVRKDPKELVTSLGSVHFEKTYFKNKRTGERAYLLDRILHIESRERMTEDAGAKLLEEAVQTSCRRGGEESSLTGSVSRETVKNKIRQLDFPKSRKRSGKKKEAEYLYIDADEDHVSLQFKEEKGDLEIGENHRKNNCVLAKLIYVYEGIEKEAPRSKRNQLINPHYFSGVYEGEKNQELWDEVYEYIESRYDLDKIKKIYPNADGGSWIKGGKKRIGGMVEVLDEFHLQKYLLKATSHMLDSADDARRELCKAIKNGTKEEFNEVMERIAGCASTETGLKRIEESRIYILNNWTAAKIRLSNRKTAKGCSAEGRVSRVLSSRMSSRPMGWSRRGADKMSHLRAYYLNGGEMLELVREQKKEVLPKAAGAENDVLSCEEILRSEKNKHEKLGKYMESMTHSVSREVKKFAWFNAHICGM